MKRPGTKWKRKGLGNLTWAEGEQPREDLPEGIKVMTEGWRNTHAHNSYILRVKLDGGGDEHRGVGSHPRAER